MTNIATIIQELQPNHVGMSQFDESERQAIRDAIERGVSPFKLAHALREAGKPISDNALRKWTRKEGITH